MNHFRLIILFFLCLTLCCKSTEKTKRLQGSPQFEPSKKSLPSGWKFQASADKDTVMGGMVNVTVALVNETQDTISLHWDNTLNPLIDIHVVNADGQHVHPYSIACGISSPKVIRVAPHESYSEVHDWWVPSKDQEKPTENYSIIPYLRGDRDYEGAGTPAIVTVVRRKG